MNYEHNFAVTFLLQCEGNYYICAATPNSILLLRYNAGIGTFCTRKVRSCQVVRLFVEKQKKKPTSITAQEFKNYVRHPLERFYIDCRKIKTKVITLANHNRHKQHNEPIRAQRKYMQPASSAGKRVRASHDWFWFYF